MQAIKPTEKCDAANGDNRLRRDKHISSDADREKKCTVCDSARDAN
jgi:hypothetical protein